MADRGQIALQVSVRTAIVHEWVARDGRFWGLALITYRVEGTQANTMAVLVNEDDLDDGD